MQFLTDVNWYYLIIVSAEPLAHLGENAVTCRIHIK